jgi:glycosyltransferase involved in cell wall biosynthesis
MPPETLVSVIIPVFNGEATIARAIQSALDQRFDGGFEVIVVNDGSTDGTAAILESFGDRIRVVVQQENRGLAAARNAGVRASRGKYLAFLDADDEWRADKLAKTVAALEENPECGLAYSDVWLFNPGGKLIAQSQIPDECARAPSFDDLLARWWHVVPSAVVMRRTIFDATGGFSEEFRAGHGGEDFLMWLMAREVAPFKLVLESLVGYCLVTGAGQVEKRLRELVDYRTRNPSGPLLGAGEDVLVRLVRARYGRRARRFTRGMHRLHAGLLIALGLTAMQRRDPRLARKLYLASLRTRPLQTKIFLRLAWTFVPARLGHAIAARLPAHYGRSLVGPPVTE